MGQDYPCAERERESASRRRGMVSGKYSYNLRRRLFLGVFPTADKSRRTRARTVTSNKIRRARVFLFRNHSCPSIVSSILATNSLGCISKAPEFSKSFQSSPVLFHFQSLISVCVQFLQNHSTHLEKSPLLFAGFG